MMLKELVVLKKIGIQKIYEDTHISIKYIKSIVNEDYDALNKIQFLGFVSILEREYNLKLTATREKGLAYFDEHLIVKHTEANVYAEPKSKINFIYIYIAVAVVIFIFIAYKSFNDGAIKLSDTKFDNSAIEDATQKIVVNNSIDIKKVETNSTIAYKTEEINKTKAEIKVQKEVVKKVLEKKIEKLKPLIIIPRSRVWIGYINKTDNKKNQKVTKNRVVLDQNKVWLLSFGHGHVNIKTNGKLTKLNGSKHVGLLYKNGKITKLTDKEFKKLNKGRLW